ncbi:hypothetical protein ACNI65_06520 [Roseateles sp. So40a]|uniref:hypothetical protein n=1 Tax=Roseateles sp. So40a TaxID=3400226 RepID=UPI003A84E552
MFDFDPINSKEADAQQRKLIESLVSFKNSFVSLNTEAEALYEVRVGAALGVMTKVDGLVSRFSNQPQEFPKAIKQFWDADARIRDLAAMLHEAESLTEQMRVGPESIAQTIGIDAAAASSIFMSARMLTSLGGPTMRTVLGILGASTSTYGIAGGASAGLMSLLGAGVGARVVAAPTMAMPLVGQIIGAGLLVLTGKQLWDAAKKNAEIARLAAESRAKVQLATQEVLTQGIYLEGIRSYTERLIGGLLQDLEEFEERGVVGTDFTALSEAAQEHLASIVNKVMSLSEMLTKTAADALDEARAEAAKRRAVA